jgi:hypothetical protein
MTELDDPIAFELFKNAVFSIADEMALTVFRTTYSGVLKDNMDYSTGLADADGKLVAQGLRPIRESSRTTWITQPAWPTPMASSWRKA